MENIIYINRKTGQKETEIVKGPKTMNYIYNKRVGQFGLRLLFKRKIFSSYGGWVMNKDKSTKKIDEFLKVNNLDMSQFVVPEGGYKNFNDFFYRKLQPNKRPIGNDLVSPADGKVVAFKTIGCCIDFYVKDCTFNLITFLKDKELAEKYEGGSMMVIRLAPADYHRFHFPANGIPSETKKIKGYYYSVSPIALKQNMRIFLENKREYSTLKTKEYGDILLCDVGATLTGSIIQTYTENQPVKKGEEKGHFAFGGSTVVVLFEKGKITIDADLLENTQKGFETTVEMGETIGK
jgi:phosphatidylserine decarboxylase